MYVDKFYKVLNVNNDALIVMCVAPEGLLPDHMAKANGVNTKKSYYRGTRTANDIKLHY